MQTKILVIEDDPAFRHSLAKLLKNNGFHVRESTSGKTGVPAALRQIPDLVILDLVMPGKNGWQGVQGLRSQKRFQTVAIVLLTVETYRHSFEKAILTGASDYLTKPISTEALKGRLRRFLE